MNGLISNVIMGVGKQVWKSLSEPDGAAPANRAEQLLQFEQRLDFAVNPDKAAFKAYLDRESIHSMEGVEFLSQKLKDGLLSDPALSRFVSQNGGFASEFSIEQRSGNYVLTGTRGQEWIVPANSALETRVSQLHHIENVRQLAALRPGLGLQQLVDLAFAPESVSALR